LTYLLALQQGRSAALNFAVAHTEDDYLGFIDDDEKIDSAWFEVAATHIRHGNVDFLGGPCLPDWQSPPPAWLPIHVDSYRGVLGWIEQTDRVQPFKDFGGGLCGGNCMIRRTALLEAGGFSTGIGRSSGNLMGGEDDELHYNLSLRNFHGVYDPALIIYHFIPNFRMTRRYHLRWAFWSGATLGVRLRWWPPASAPSLLGLPRHYVGKALRGLMGFVRFGLSSAPKSQARSFTGLMDALYLPGLWYGKFIVAKKMQKDAVPSAMISTQPPSSSV
jgi:glycosyltransferase involved in cell wall biosynthesis